MVDGRLERKPNPMENSDIQFEELVQMFASMPADIFKQEILAEFIEREGMVFRNIDACMGAPLNADPGRHTGHKIVAGIDWGKQADFTTLSVGCATCGEEVARDRFNKIDYVFQRSRLGVTLDRWRAFGLVELNSVGTPNFEMLQRDGLRVSAFETTPASKPPLIENLALAFERTEWQFQSDPVWTAELEAYERKVSPATGRSAYSAPEGMHDDTVIARALMVWHGRNSRSLPDGQPTCPSRWTVGQGQTIDDNSEESRWRRY